MTNTDLIWERDTANEFTLWNADEDHVCTIVRDHQRRYSFSGAALYANDTTKPMVWTIVRPGHPTRSLGQPGMSVREAKKAAVAIITR